MPVQAKPSQAKVSQAKSSQVEQEPQGAAWASAALARMPILLPAGSHMRVAGSVVCALAGSVLCAAVSAAVLGCGGRCVLAALWSFAGCGARIGCALRGEW